MKRLFILLLIVVGTAGVFAKPSVKGKVAIGGDILEKTDGDPDFGNLYLLTEVSAGNDYVTAAGKLYYRLSMADDSKDLDKEKSLSQKIDLKRAYIRVRPMGNEILEFSIGKLYSYYLPGNYFALSEIYTGSSRWGKTGVGLKFEKSGFTLGAALPVTESYAEFKSSRGFNGALGYDFKNLNENLPLKIGATLLYNHSETEVKDKPASIDDDFSFTGSINFSKKFEESKFSFNTTLSYSWNSEPFVASSVFKNIASYDAEGLNKSQFLSINQTLDFSKFKFTLEGEIGKSREKNWIPVYTGLLTVFKLTEEFSLRPRFFYYASLNSDDKDLGRQTFEFYPRVWFEKGKWIAAAGVDFSHFQTAPDKWEWHWKIPFIVEYKF